MDSILLQNISKVFKIAHDRKTGIKSFMLGLFTRSLSYEIFFALKDISLKVKKGEFIGIIGPNGSGKSTLLKIIAGVIQPTDGKVFVHGKISPFLELGVGFQGDLTVKENVYFYGSLLGMDAKKLQKRFATIIAFAELEKFIDTKLKNLSSGMVARLGFSIAIQVDADILLVDEVLAVGDVSFQKKCLDAFKQLKNKHKTVILVTHDLNLIKNWCDKALLIDSGTLKLEDKPSKVIESYIRRGRT